jgi:hypothetical protein
MVMELIRAASPEGRFFYLTPLLPHRNSMTTACLPPKSTRRAFARHFPEQRWHILWVFKRFFDRSLFFIFGLTLNMK